MVRATRDVTMPEGAIAELVLMIFPWRAVAEVRQPVIKLAARAVPGLLSRWQRAQECLTDKPVHVMELPPAVFPKADRQIAMRAAGALPEYPAAYRALEFAPAVCRLDGPVKAPHPAAVGYLIETFVARNGQPSLSHVKQYTRVR
jgi:hypothetical protein